MTAVALALVLAAGFAPPFWARDLGGVIRRLADPSPAPDERDRALFSDLVQLADCAPLPALAPDDPEWPLRQLVRIEAARGARLQRAGHLAGTLWADWPRPGFFRRDARALPGELLRWPVEREVWPGEVIQVPLAPSHCPEGIPARTETLEPDLLTRLETFSRSRRVNARPVLPTLAYALAADAPSTAPLDVQVAANLDPLAVPPRLSPFVRLLRAERKLDPASEWLSLAKEPTLGEARWVAVAGALEQAPAAADVLAITEGFDTLVAEPQARALALYVAFHRVRALRALGRDADARALLRSLAAALARDRSPQALALRALAVSVFASGPLSPEDAAAVDRLEGWEAVGARALVAGEDAALRVAVNRLRQSSSLRGHVLAERFAAERALVRHDASGFELSTTRLLAALSSDATARERAEAADLAVALFEALVRRDAEAPDPRWEARVRHAMTEAAGWTDERHAQRLAGLQRALAANRRAHPGEEVALGTLPVDALQPPPPAPALQVDWPEPYSLLAVPAPDGTLRSVAPEPALAVEVVHAR